MSTRSSRGVGSPMVGAILAAGRGTRMWPFSRSYPKPLLPICNKPLIVHQIEMMRAVGVMEIVILIGHKGYEITRILGGGENLGVRLRYVEQTEMLGIAHAVGHLEDTLDGPFMLLLGDIYFKAPKLADLMDTFHQRQVDGVLAVKNEPDPRAIRRNYSVVLSEEGLVRRVIEKPRHPPSQLKGVGLYVFNLAIFDAIRRTPRTAMRDEYELTDAIQVMIDDGYRVCVSDVVDEDLNLTDPNDLLAVNLREACALGHDTLIDPRATVAAPDRVRRSVVGAHARIHHPIDVTESLVFEHTEVRVRHALHRSIVTPEGILECKPGGGMEGDGQ